MTTKFTRTTFVMVILILCHASFFGQGNNIEIRFLKAKVNDTTSGKDLTVFFLVSTKDSASFPPVVNLPPKCTVFEGGREKIVLFTQDNLAVALYGDNVEEKNKEVYELLKKEIDFHPKNPQMIVAYTIKDLYYVFTKMTLTPAFSEKLNRAIRIDKRCEFTVQ